MQFFQGQHITQSEIVKLILYKGVIQETTHSEGEYVSSVFLRRRGFLLLTCKYFLLSIRSQTFYRTDASAEKNIWFRSDSHL